MAWSVSGSKIEGPGGLLCTAGGKSSTTLTVDSFNCSRKHKM